MAMIDKLCEALDNIASSLDVALQEDPDTVLTESQLDEALFEDIDRLLGDVDLTLENVSPEALDAFNKKLDALMESDEMELLTERNIVRLDRNSVFKQLVGLLSLVIARRRKDPQFRVYKKGSLIRRKAKQSINAKYSSRAIPLARKLIARRKFKS